MHTHFISLRRLNHYNPISQLDSTETGYITYDAVVTLGITWLAIMHYFYCDIRTIFIICCNTVSSRSQLFPYYELCTCFRVYGSQSYSAHRYWSMMHNSPPITEIFGMLDSQTSACYKASFHVESNKCSIAIRTWITNYINENILCNYYSRSNDTLAKPSLLGARALVCNYIPRKPINYDYRSIKWWPIKIVTIHPIQHHVTDKSFDEFDKLVFAIKQDRLITMNIIL